MKLFNAVNILLAVSILSHGVLSRPHEALRHLARAVAETPTCQTECDEAFIALVQQCYECLAQSCVSDYGILADRIADTPTTDTIGHNEKPPVIELCEGSTIVFSEPIDITNHHFELACPKHATEACALSGGGTSQIFKGGADWGNLSTHNVKVQNTAFVQGDGSYGGAVETSGGTLVFEDCSFSDNTATEWGGALYALNPDLTITRCEFENNGVTGPIAGGGALHVIMETDGMVKISDSKFISNSAIRGGAIHCSGPFLHVTGTEFSRNTADVGDDIQANQGCTCNDRKNSLCSADSTDPSGLCDGATYDSNLCL